MNLLAKIYRIKSKMTQTMNNYLKVLFNLLQNIKNLRMI